MPDVNRLLAVNIGVAGRKELREELLEIKDHLLDSKTRIQNGLKEWDAVLERIDAGERRQEKMGLFPLPIEWN